MLRKHAALATRSIDRLGYITVGQASGFPTESWMKMEQLGFLYRSFSRTFFFPGILLCIVMELQNGLVGERSLGL